MAAKGPVLPASKTLIHLADRAVLLHFNRTIHKQQEESPRIVMTLSRRNITTVFAKQEQGSWPVSGQMNAEKYTLYVHRCLSSAVLADLSSEICDAGPSHGSGQDSGDLSPWAFSEGFVRVPSCSN